MSSFDDIIGGDVINEKKRDIRPVNHIVFVVDKSGSMMGREQEVKEAFKSHLDETLTVKDQDNYFSLFTFNERVDESFFEREVKEDTSFNEIDNYSPDGMTALYDALGLSISKVEKISGMNDENENHSALFIVITDGMENQSREYKEVDIKKKIKKLEEEKDNWTFTFVGVQFDVNAQYADKFHMNVGNTVTFDSLDEAKGVMGQSLGKFYSNRSRGMTKTYSYSVDSPTAEDKKKDDNRS